MARAFLIKKRFQNRTRKVYQYLKEDWNENVAEAFLVKLEGKMRSVIANPTLGGPSASYKNLRSLGVTKHNRLFYRLEKDSIVFVMLSDTRQRRYKR